MEKIIDGKKKCTGCGETKEVELFIKNTNVKSGIGSLCFICEQKRTKKWRDANKDKVKKYDQTKNKKEYKKKYYVEHKETITERKRKEYQEDKERYIQKSKEYRDAHKEEINERRRLKYKLKKSCI